MKSSVSQQSVLTFKKSGFVLLLAMLVSSLLLSIGLAVFNITIKQVTLASAGRESQFAFYVADTGIECALYWDIQHGAFAVSSASDIMCNEQTFSVGGSGFDVPMTFTINFPPDLYCAIVSVTKTDLGGGATRTIIESRGYNTCDTSNTRRVERAIRVRY